MDRSGHTARTAPASVVGDNDMRPLLVKAQIAHAPSGPVRVPQVKVVFTVSGWARVHSPRGDALLEAGSILTIPAGLECSGFPEGHARTVTFYLRPDYLSDQVRWLSATHPLVHDLHRALDGEPALHSLHIAPAAMSELAPHLVSLTRPSAHRLSDFETLSIAASVFDTVGRLAGLSSGTVEIASRVPRREVALAIALLRDNLSQRWRINDLARAVALSPSQLARLFRTQLGVSPAAFLQQLRADRMAELLSSTDLSIREAATAVGWSDSALASRSFKQRFGVAPRAYASSSRHLPQEQSRGATAPVALEAPDIRKYAVDR